MAPSRMLSVTLRFPVAASAPLTIACQCLARVLPLEGGLRPACLCPCHSAPVDSETADGMLPNHAHMVVHYNVPAGQHCFVLLICAVAQAVELLR